MKIEAKNGQVEIKEVPFDGFGFLSSTGKTYTIAHEKGFFTDEVTIDGKKAQRKIEVKVAISVPNPDYKKG